MNIRAPLCNELCSELGRKLSKISFNNSASQRLLLKQPIYFTNCFCPNSHLRFGSKIMRVTSIFKNDVPRFTVFMVPITINPEPLTKLPEKSRTPVVFLSLSLSFSPCAMDINQSIPFNKINVNIQGSMIHNNVCSSIGYIILNNLLHVSGYLLFKIESNINH